MVIRWGYKNGKGLRMRNAACRAAGVLLITGIGLIFSGIFLYAGVVLALLAAAVFLLGCAASWVLPRALVLWEIARPPAKKATETSHTNAA